MGVVVISERIRVPPRYRLLEEVGQGGMAIVYRAQDESLKREVAVKVLHPHLSAEPESKARLEREARAVAKLKHDNILEIFDYSGSDADSAYIVTEFIEGQTLKQFLSSKSIRHPEVAALITVELGNALSHAHGLGIIHRDIKPENVMIRNDGLLKLMDFGIAQILDLERMTVTGQLLGSPAYMAPELVEGRPLDVRTDVFSVGVLLYQMATGALPFSGKNPHEVLRRITEGRFPDARGLNRLCSAGLCRVLARALARDPADRYPQMQALVTDLRQYLEQAGLTEPRDELGQYFRDPDGYEAALPARMTPALTASAERHLAARAAGAAIECWNRVLAYAPEDMAVLGALRRLEGRNRRRVIGLYAFVGLGVVGLLAGIGGVLLHVLAGPTPPPLMPAHAAAVDPKAASSPGPSGPAASRRPTPARVGSASGAGTTSESRSATTRAGRLRAGATAAAGSGPPEDTGTGAIATTATDSPGGETAANPSLPKPAGESSPQSTPPGTDRPVRTFTLGPTPQNVDVYLDGERQFSYDTDHLSLQVPVSGNHVIEFRSPSGCCFVERIEVGPDRPLPPDNIIARKLKWKPARLVVTTAPEAAKARIMVRDPEHPGRGTVVAPGEEVNVPFYPTDEGQKEVEISADSAAGFGAQRVMVRAGQRKNIVLTLGITP
jgi:tRNA A-37 threonylcarbamoyl transferase component Bud32